MRVPRAGGILVVTLGAAAMHALVPYELWRLDGRVRGRRKAPRRGVGLLVVAAGAALVTWAMAAHYEAAPRGWALESRLTPEYLLRRGPYRVSRNPMYVGEAFVWLGWALFYGSPAIWAGLAIICAALAKIVRWEERRLVERFGDDYRAYSCEVPRWVPRVGRAGARR